jgi:hypothetical protein
MGLFLCYTICRRIHIHTERENEMRTLDDALQERRDEKEREQREQIEKRRREEREQKEREQRAVERFKVWLSDRYGFDAGSLNASACEYLSGRDHFTITVKIYGGKVESKTSFSCESGTMKSGELWHAVYSDYYYDYHNFFDAVLYVQESERREAQ